jgi:Flp pilus assembly CpaF family ATPase
MRGHAVGAQRVIDMIKTAFGPLGALSNDPNVVEIMANPDGRVWFERAGEAMQDSGLVLTADERQTIIELVASSRAWPPLFPSIVCAFAPGCLR